MVPFVLKESILKSPNFSHFIIFNLVYMLTTFHPSVVCIIETIPIKFVVKTMRFMIDKFSEFYQISINYEKTKKLEHLS